MTAITDVVDLEVRGKIALVTVDNPPVNALARGVRDGLFEAVTQAREDTAVEAVVIACRGRTFIAGADIREFGRPQYRGGPVFWADSLGLDTIVARMQEFQEQDGDDRFWQPAALLEQLAREGKGFKDL